MKKLLPKLLLGAAGVWVGSMLIYWFNLDNKAIYFLVRPLLDKIYDHRKVDGKVCRFRPRRSGSCLSIRSSA